MEDFLEFLAVRSDWDARSGGLAEKPWSEIEEDIAEKVKKQSLKGLAVPLIQRHMQRRDR